MSSHGGLWIGVSYLLSLLSRSFNLFLLSLGEKKIDLKSGFRRSRYNIHLVRSTFSAGSIDRIDPNTRYMMNVPWGDTSKTGSPL
jgi:hypothetical protein